MPRPEKPVEATHTRLAKLAVGLRELRAQHSDLTYRELARRTGYAFSVLSEAASGRRVPSWDVVKAYVEACDGDPNEWLQVWRDAVEDARTSQNRDHERELESPDKRATAGSYAHAGALINLQKSSPAQSNQRPRRHASQDTSSTTSPIRIFLVDDHEIVRRGVADLFQDEPDLEIVGEAATVTEALARIPSESVDVAVLDLRLPDGTGVELCRDLRSRQPGLRCLILTSYSDDEALLNAIMAGASGFVLKHVLGADLITAVRRVGAGESLLDTKTTEALIKRIRQGRDDDGSQLAGLTDQERAVFDLVGQGLTNRQIASQLFLAERTVKNYVSHLLTKLGMQRRTQAAVLAAELKSRKP